MKTEVENAFSFLHLVTLIPNVPHKFIDRDHECQALLYCYNIIIYICKLLMIPQKIRSPNVKCPLLP